MPDRTVLNLNYLWTELVKVGLILQRPAVQIQLLGIAATILISWLFIHFIWAQLRRQFPFLKQVETSDTKLSGWQFSAVFVRYLLGPTLFLIVICLLEIGFDRLGWVDGYLRDGIAIGLYLWFYRLFLACLYSLFPADSVSRYRKFFLAPLFYLFAIGSILSWFVDLIELSQVTIVNLFGSPLTLESALVIVAGLYFWIVGTPLLVKLLILVFLGRKPQDEATTQVVSILLRYSLIGLGIVFIFGYVGVNATALAAITGGLSVGIGFGLKEVISNFVSGIWLLIERAIKPGDVITIDGQMSVVKDLGIRATTVLVDKDNSEEIIPNQTLFTQNIATLTKTNRLIKRSVFVGASYECSPEKVIEILLQVAKDNPKVLDAPSPSAFMIEFGDSSINFELKFWIKNPLISKSVISQLSRDIWQAFADNHIEIPFPQRDLHIRNGRNDDVLTSNPDSTV